MGLFVVLVMYFGVYTTSLKKYFKRWYFQVTSGSSICCNKSLFKLGFIHILRLILVLLSHFQHILLYRIQLLSLRAVYMLLWSIIMSEEKVREWMIINCVDAVVNINRKMWLVTQKALFKREGKLFFKWIRNFKPLSIRCFSCRL